MLDLSKIEAGKMELYLESFDLTPMLRDAMATIQPLVLQKGNHLILETPDDLGTMHADITHPSGPRLAPRQLNRQIVSLRGRIARRLHDVSCRQDCLRADEDTRPLIAIPTHQNLGANLDAGPGLRRQLAPAWQSAPDCHGGTKNRMKPQSTDPARAKHVTLQEKPGGPGHRGAERLERKTPVPGSDGYRGAGWLGQLSVECFPTQRQPRVICKGP